MSADRRYRRRRLHSLGWGDLTASIVVPAAGLWISSPWGDAWPVLMLGAASLLIMLMSAASFWLMRAHRSLSAARVRRVSFAMHVSVAIAGMALLLALAARWDASRAIAPVVGVGMPLFTVLEWVNYRWVQISAGGLRAALVGKPIEPQLAKTLRRYKARK